MRKADTEEKIKTTRLPLWHYIASYLIIFCGQLFVYLPVLTHRYLVPDDYDYFMAGVTNSDKFTIQAIGQGRLFNILVAPSFAWIGRIDDMWIIRLIGLLGIFALAICIFHTFRKYGEKIFLSAIFALLITIMPAFQEYASWAVLYLAPWGAVVAYAAFLSIERALMKIKWHRFLWSTIAIFLMVFAYNIHPTSATFIAVFITIFFLYKKAENRFLHTLFFLLISGLGAVANFTIFKIYLFLLNTQAIARTTLIDDPFEKLSWFITRPFYKSINLIYLPANIWVAVLVGLTIIVGLTTIFLHNKQKDILINFVILTILLLFSYSSNLIIDENLANYRTLLALTGVLAVMFFAAIREIVGLLGKFKNIASYTLFILITISCLLFANISLTELIIQRTEGGLELFRDKLKSFNSDLHNNVIVTYSNNTEKIAFDTQVFFHIPMIESILFENDRYKTGMKVLVQPDKSPRQANSFVISAKTLLMHND